MLVANKDEDQEREVLLYQWEIFIAAMGPIFDGKAADKPKKDNGRQYLKQHAADGLHYIYDDIVGLGKSVLLFCKASCVALFTKYGGGLAFSALADALCGGHSRATAIPSVLPSARGSIPSAAASRATDLLQQPQPISSSSSSHHVNSLSADQVVQVTRQFLIGNAGANKDKEDAGTKTIMAKVGVWTPSRLQAATHQTWDRL